MFSISEQVSGTANSSAMYKIDTASANAVTTVASGLACADLMTLLPGGDILTGQSNCGMSAVKDVARITQAGTVTTLGLTGLDRIDGLAYDPAGKRLFVINEPTTGNKQLVIFPYDGG